LDRLWAGWRATYIDGVANAEPTERADECLFERLAAAPDDDALVLARNEHAFAVMNAYPYSSGHLMVAPLRHESAPADLPRAAATRSSGPSGRGESGSRYRARLRADDDALPTEERDRLPEDLDVTAYVGPYLFPTMERRRIPATMYLVLGAICVLGWLQSGNG